MTKRWPNLPRYLNAIGKIYVLYKQDGYAFHESYDRNALVDQPILRGSGSVSKSVDC